MKPIGVFGGVFDPIHFGHLRAALEVTEHGDYERLLFIPCGQPPHGKSPAAPAALRAEMVRVAIAGESRFVLDERELTRGGPSYTADTLEALRQ